MLLDPSPLVLPVESTTVVDAAELYARAQLPPVPVYGLTSDGRCTCGEGDECPKPGKHPSGNAWQRKATLDLDEVRDRFRGHRGNIGIYLGLTGLVLIDADGEAGLETAATWNLPPTLTAQSGSGVGAHYVYRFAPNHDPRAVTDRSKFAPGLDVKARGQFVVSPSRHASGGVYRWTLVVPPTVLPDWLYARLRKPEPSYAPAPELSGDDPTALEKRARAYLARIPPAISGADGHKQTFATARALASFHVKGLPERTAWNLLLEYNATCKPPWSERELSHKWTDAKNAKKLPAIKDRPRVAPRLYAVPPPGAETEPTSEPPEPTAPKGPDWRSSLRWAVTRQGTDRLITDTDNLVRILQLDPRWQGRITFDEFRHRICVAEDLPWDSYNKPSSYLGYWTDEDATRMAGWMRREWDARRFEPTRNDCEHAVQVVARTHDFNPVRTYLDSVPWDGTPRLGTWLSTYLGAPQTEYTRLVGAWWLISAVARIYDPGCKVDTVPILEGPQGLKKSTALKVLAGAAYFNDTPIDIGSKDAYTAIQGCWFVELAELESLMKATASKSKAFFSSAKDRFRRAYARHERDELRQCIFVGTVNLKEYLNDPTGARRFWPIPCTRIDIEGIARDRDLLWAEAVSEYQAGRQWYPEAQDDHTHLVEVQAERTEVDAWEPRVAEWLRSAPDEVTTGEVLQGALNLEPKDWTRSNQTRVGVMLTSRMGWRKRQVKRSGIRLWLYERGEVVT